MPIDMGELGRSMILLGIALLLAAGFIVGRAPLDKAPMEHVSLWVLLAALFAYLGGWLLVGLAWIGNFA